MLQSPEKNSQNSQFSSNPNTVRACEDYDGANRASHHRPFARDQGRNQRRRIALCGCKIEGTINLADNRVTVGRNGVIAANITAREVVIMGKVTGNIQCSDRLDIRAEGSLAGDVTTMRISVEDGAVLKGSVQVRTADGKHDKQNQNQQKQVTSIEQPKAAAAAAGQA